MKRIERFDKYMKYRGLNDNKVTVQLGLSGGTIAKSRLGNRDLSDRVIEKIRNFYRDLNIDWLITGKVEVNYTKGGIGRREIKEKWELVSTHTARRTGATLLVKAGAPVAWVMRVTGHRSEKTFLNYIRLSSEEYAELVRKYVERI